MAISKAGSKGEPGTAKPGAHSYETNKWPVLLETRAAFACCNWSIKMDRIVWVGSTSVDIGPPYVNNLKRLGSLPFWVHVKMGNSLKQKHILSLATKI